MERNGLTENMYVYSPFWTPSLTLLLYRSVLLIERAFFSYNIEFKKNFGCKLEKWGDEQTE